MTGRPEDQALVPERSKGDKAVFYCAALSFADQVHSVKQAR